MPSGRTRRGILEGLQQRTGKRRPELDLPAVPAGGEVLLEWFTDISVGRGSNGFGPSHLSASEILAWSQLTGWRLTPFEFRALRQLDRCWMRAWNEVQDE